MSLPGTIQDQYTVDATLCQPFVNATIHTLSMMCGLTVVSNKPTFKKPNDTCDLAIFVDLVNEFMLGCVSVCFSKSMFLGILGRMLGETYTDYSPEVRDGAKELINIISNHARKDLSKKDFNAIRAMPHIAFGNHVSVEYLTRSQTIVLPFQTEVGPFSIEVTTQNLTISDRI